MFFALFLSLFTFFSTTFFGYWMHWMLHQDFFGKFHQSHMTHHLKLYPPNDFFSEEYRDAGKDSTFWFFLVAGAPLVFLPIVLFIFGYIGLFTGLFLLAETIALGLLNNYLHDSFHLKNHWLNFFSFFKKFVALHQHHHEDMGTNYGIFFFLWDKLFGTFKNNANL